MLISYQYLDTLLGDTGLGGAGDNSTISSLETNTGNSTQAGDTGDLDPVSGTQTANIASSFTLSRQVSSIPDVAALTAMYFVLNFLAATQDVAVDGYNRS